MKANWCSGRCPRPWQEGWNFKGSSNPNHYMILPLAYLFSKPTHFFISLFKRKCYKDTSLLPLELHYTVATIKEWLLHGCVFSWTPHWSRDWKCATFLVGSLMYCPVETWTSDAWNGSLWSTVYIYWFVWGGGSLLPVSSVLSSAQIPPYVVGADRVLLGQMVLLCACIDGFPLSSC